MRYQTDLILRLGAIILALLLPSWIYTILLAPTLTITSTILGTQATVSENIIFIQEYALAIIPACLAILAYQLLAILILATKSIDIKKRVTMFLVGSLIIFTANIIRIILLAQLIQQDYILYQQWHFFTWNALSTIFVVALWIGLTIIFNVRSIPFYSDFKTMQQNLKKQE